MALAVFIASDAWPADATPSQRVEISGRQDADEERYSDVQTRIVMGREEILKLGDRSIVDILRRLPGVTVSLSPTGVATFRLRGLGGTYTQLLLNGLPLPAGVTLDSIPPDTIDRIEVLRSTSAESGAQGIAGSINVVVRSRPSRGASSNVKVSVGSTDGRLSIGGTGATAGQTVDSTWSIALTLDRTETMPRAKLYETDVRSGGDVPTARDGTRDHWYRVETVNLVPRWRWAVDETTAVTVDGFFSRSQLSGRQIETTSTTQGEGLVYPDTRLQFISPTGSARTSIELVRSLSQGATLTAKLGGNFVRRDSDAEMEGRSDLGILTLQRSVESAAYDKSLTTAGKYAFPFIEGHEVSGGWDASVTTRNEDRIQEDRDPSRMSTVLTDESYRSEIHRVAVYLQDEWKPSKKRSVYWGVRWETLQTKSVGSLLTNVSTKSSVLSPVIQTVFQIPGDLTQQVRLALARTYKAPLASDLMPRRFIAKNNSAVTPDYQGNPDLRPELAWALDAALEISNKGVWQVNGSGYFRTINDVTRLDLYEQNGTWINRPFNGGKARAWGLEIDAKSPLPLIKGVKFSGNVAWNRSRIGGLAPPYNRINGQVPMSLSLSFDTSSALPYTNLGINFGIQRGGAYQISDRLLFKTGNTRSAEAYILRRFGVVSIRASFAVTQPQSEDRIFSGSGGTLRQLIENSISRRIRFQVEAPLG